MSQPQPPKPTTATTATRRAPTATHLVASTSAPSGKFRRSDLQFTREKQSWSLEELRALWGGSFDAKLEAVIKEPLVVAKLCTAEDAAAESKPARREAELEATNAQLLEHIRALETRLAVLEAPKG
jgi:hypothetical protein